MEIKGYNEIKDVRTKQERILNYLQDSNIREIKVTYKEPKSFWAIFHPPGEPLDVQQYTIYGEELVSGKPIWEWTSCRDAEGLFFVPGPILASFATKEEALAALPKYENRWAFAG